MPDQRPSIVLVAAVVIVGLIVLVVIDQLVGPEVGRLLGTHSETV